jgi:hypothetical protein
LHGDQVNERGRDKQCGLMRRIEEHLGIEVCVLPQAC